MSRSNIPVYGVFFGAILSVTLLFPTETTGQDKPMHESSVSLLKQRVQENARSTNTIACDFTQEKVLSMISEKISSGGRFYLKKEKMLRWEYTLPFSYVIIINNDRIAIRDENKVNRFNLQSNKVFLEISRIIQGSIQGTLLNDEEHFKVSCFENPANWVVRLKPVDPKLKETLSEIVIRLNRKDYTVDRVEMHEPGGDFTSIVFTAKKLNQPIPDENFSVN